MAVRGNTKLSKPFCDNRLTMACPIDKPIKIAGMKQTFSNKVLNVIRPSCQEKGILDRFNSRKKTAPVPTNADFDKPKANMVKAKTGPAALAIMVVKPTRMPADQKRK